jgi:hypothetical protein
MRINSKRLAAACKPSTRRLPSNGLSTMSSGSFQHGRIPTDKKATLSDAEIDARIENGRATADKLNSAQREADDWLATFAKKIARGAGQAS